MSWMGGAGGCRRCQHTRPHQLPPEGERSAPPEMKKKCEGSSNNQFPSNLNPFDVGIGKKTHENEGGTKDPRLAHLAEGDGERYGGVAGVLDGDDPAPAAAGVGGEVREVGEPRRGGAWQWHPAAAELACPEAAEERRGGPRPRRHRRGRRERGG